MRRTFPVAVLAVFLAPRPAGAVGVVKAGGKAFARVVAAVRGLEPLEGGLLVVGRGSCYFATLADVEKPPVGRGEDLGGVTCDAAATDGQDQAVWFGARQLKALTYSAADDGLERQKRQRTLLGGADDMGGLPTGPPDKKTVEDKPLEATVLLFAPDGKALVFGAESGQVSLIAYPDVSAGPRTLDRLPAGVLRLRFGADGVLFALDKAGHVGAWDWLTEKPAAFPEELARGTRALATARKAPVLARWRAGKGVEVYSTGDWKRTRALPMLDRAPAVFELDDEGNTLAYSEGAAVALLDLRTGRPLGYVAHGLGRVSAVRFLTGGRLAAGSENGRLLVLSVPAGLAKSVGKDEVDPPKDVDAVDLGESPALVNALPTMPPPLSGSRPLPPKPLAASKPLPLSDKPLPPGAQTAPIARGVTLSTAPPPMP